MNDTIAALDRTVSITLEDPSGQAPRVTNQEVLGYDMYIMYSYLLIDQMVGKPHPVNIPMMARGSEAGSPPSSAP